MKCSSDRVLVAIIIFLLGMGTLLPWNFFITSLDYFNARLNTTTTTTGNVSESEADPYMFNNMCVLISQLPLLLFTLLNSFLYQRIPEKVRIAGSMSFILLLFILTAILVKIKMEQDTFFSITMITIWFINMFGAVLQGSLFGLVGKLPQKYSSLFMSGQAMAGIFSAVAMLIFKISETDHETAALGYFITPCVATLLMIFCYLLLPHLKFARLYLSNAPTDTVQTMQESLLKEKENVSLVKMKRMDETHVAEGNGHLTSSFSDPEAAKTLKNRGEKEDNTPEEKSSVLQVFKKIWVMALCVTCVFMVTLSVFPAITVLVRPNNLFTGIWADIFIAVCCFIVFNVMDWIGRSIPSFVQWPSKQSCLFPILVVARVIFIPAFMFCNIPSNTSLPKLFKHEFAYMTVMSLFAMTNGYFACLSMSYAPQLVKSKDAETAGALMTFFLALGLSLGAALSFGMKLLV